MRENEDHEIRLPWYEKRPYRRAFHFPGQDWRVDADWDEIVRPAAAADIEDAFLWYERQRPGLEDEFLDAIQAACESIAAHPIFGNVPGGVVVEGSSQLPTEHARSWKLRQGPRLETGTCARSLVRPTSGTRRPSNMSGSMQPIPASPSRVRL
jgi:plasmid stabilization system protein ParE